MQVREVMTTSPKCCVPSDNAANAARIMKDMNTGIVPVIESEQNRKLTGVVTDRDICLDVVAEARDARSVQVRDCMTPTLICCMPDDNVQKVIDLMHDNQIRRIPVVDHKGIIQGIVSMADLLQRSEISSRTTHETLKKVSEPTQEASKPRAQMRKSA
jgi:CBS domain-containing protein